MPRQTDTSQLNVARSWRIALAIILTLFACARLMALADDAAFRVGLIGDTTTIGGRFAADPDVPAGYLRVTTVDPGGPMEKAGLKTGDAIHTYPTYELSHRHRVGDSFSFVRERAGVRTAGQIKVEPVKLSKADRRGNFWLALNMVAALITTLIGCLILWRGWGNLTAMMLGGGMFVLNPVGLNVPMIFDGPVSSLMFLILYITALQIGYVLPVFAMRHYEESVGKLPPWQWRTLRIFLCFGMFHSVLQAWAGLTLTAFPYWITGNGVGYVTAQIAMLSCVGFLIAAWRKSQGAARNRNAVILFAFVAYVVGAIAGFAMLGASPTAANSAAAGSLAVFNVLLTGLVGPGLLAYAVLRHKLFDMGFAVNRTLVFATISAVLLAGFGLLEWAAEHLVPEEWHEGGAFFSAAIAVGLFLVFHRIRDAVEHLIERLFFNKWQRNEATLKRFVVTAAHVEKPEALAATFVAELIRFTGGAPAALYTRMAEGPYARSAGALRGVKSRIDSDDPALSAMRAEQGAVAPFEVNSPLTAELALPVMHQAVLAGFALLGPKPTGDYYRPDEIEILTWAAQQVGLDLQAIRVRDLELTNMRLVTRNQTLIEIIEKSALAGA